MWVAFVELVVNPLRYVGDLEPAFFAGQDRVEEDLVEQIPEFLLQVGEPMLDLLIVAICIELVESLERLVAFLEQVATKRGVGLLAIPRTLLPQPLDEYVEVGEGGRHRRWKLWNVYGGQMISVNFAIQVVPGNGEYPLVVSADALQDGDLHLVCIVDGQFDVAKHLLRVALSNK